MTCSPSLETCLFIMLKSCNYNNYINIAHMHVRIIDAHLRSHTHSMLVHVYIVVAELHGLCN